MSLHADKVQAAAETYIGLVEFGVGLIPGGGEIKNSHIMFCLLVREGDIELNPSARAFLTLRYSKGFNLSAGSF